ncbi:class I SAM-dependent methyltransferase [Pseudonocardia sp. TRM90224]|uniref:class I SAM-dependent methyltransferase n=1 Tax=Pseudonocardia sp. TRM90224 TaxID=2812678 RepID=UPI001E345007|nr:class I SAM-dependent methyltransferase [Pseudonocardia sp. TRM90224]
MTKVHEDLLSSQLAYYSARAATFDAGFEPYMAPAMPALLAKIRAGNLHGDLLEIASGNGFWTRYLVDVCDSITCLDGSTQMIAGAKERGMPRVSFEQVDLFSWTPTRQWKAIFFAHWLAHVPEELFETFWTSVKQAVTPDGVVEFVDVTSYERRIEEFDEHDPDVAVWRTLEDGSRYKVVKVFRDPPELEQRLGALGWNCEASEVHPGFLYATCRPVS